MTYITRPKEKRENLKRKVNLFIDPKSCHSPKLSFHLCLLSFYHPSFSTHLHSRFDLISTIEHLCSIPKDHLGPLSFKSEVCPLCFDFLLALFSTTKKERKKGKEKEKKIVFSFFIDVYRICSSIISGFFFSC
jgi:hypothetical protein